MLTYLGLPPSVENEFTSRFYQKADIDTVNILDVANAKTLTDVNIFGNSVITGDFKIDANAPLGFTRTYPVLGISASSLFTYNRVNDLTNNIPPIVSIPFWNYARGDGKGFSIDLGHFPVRLKVFQDVQNSQCNRFTISTRGVGSTTIGINKDTVGFDIDGVGVSSAGVSNLARGSQIVADKSFTAKYLGIYFAEATTSNSQMAIYNSSGGFLGKTETKPSGINGRQLFTLETEINIVSGTTYYVLCTCTNNYKVKRLTTVETRFEIDPFTLPINTGNITISTFTGLGNCIFIENNWDNIVIGYVEKNSLNIWGNGMISIGTTLSTDTYTSAGNAGDALLNPYSLLVQNDIMSGLSGLKADCTARLHIKASNAEFTANRYIALFQGGDGLGAAAITKDGEVVIGRSGMGIIMCDSVTSTYYRLRVTNGALSLAAF